MERESECSVRVGKLPGYEVGLSSHPYSPHLVARQWWLTVTGCSSERAYSFTLSLSHTHTLNFELRF